MAISKSQVFVFIILSLVLSASTSDSETKDDPSVPDEASDGQVPPSAPDKQLDEVAQAQNGEVAETHGPGQPPGGEQVLEKDLVPLEETHVPEDAQDGQGAIESGPKEAIPSDSERENEAQEGEASPAAGSKDTNEVADTDAVPLGETDTKDTEKGTSLEDTAGQDENVDAPLLEVSETGPAAEKTNDELKETNKATLDNISNGNSKPSVDANTETGDSDTELEKIHKPDKSLEKDTEKSSEEEKTPASDTISVSNNDTNAHKEPPIPGDAPPESTETKDQSSLSDSESEKPGTDGESVDLIPLGTGVENAHRNDTPSVDETDGNLVDKASSSDVDENPVPAGEQEEPVPILESKNQERGPVPPVNETHSEGSKDVLVVPPKPDTDPVPLVNKTHSEGSKDVLVVPPKPETDPVPLVNETRSEESKDVLVVPPAPDTDPVPPVNETRSEGSEDILVVPPKPDTDPVPLVNETHSEGSKDVLVVPPAPDTDPVPPVNETLSEDSPKLLNKSEITEVLQTGNVGSDLAGDNMNTTELLHVPDVKLNQTETLNETMKDGLLKNEEPKDLEKLDHQPGQSGMKSPQAKESKEEPEKGGGFQWPILVAAVVSGLVCFVLGLVVSACYNKSPEHAPVKVPMSEKDCENGSERSPFIPSTNDTKKPDARMPVKDQLSKNPPSRPFKSTDSLDGEVADGNPRLPANRSHTFPKMQRRTFYDSRELSFIDDVSDDEEAEALGRPPSVGHEKKRKQKGDLKKRLSKLLDGLEDPVMNTNDETDFHRAVENFRRSLIESEPGDIQPDPPVTETTKLLETTSDKNNDNKVSNDAEEHKLRKQNNNLPKDPLIDNGKPSQT